MLLKLKTFMWNKINRKARQRSLIPRYDGPFEVIQRVGQVAYKLKLLGRLKLHPTFHISFLKPFHEDLDKERVEEKRSPLVVMKQFDREVEKILNHRTVGVSCSTKSVYIQIYDTITKEYNLISSNDAKN